MLFVRPALRILQFPNVFQTFIITKQILFQSQYIPIDCLTADDTDIEIISTDELLELVLILIEVVVDCFGHAKVAKILLRNGALPNAVNLEGFTPLHCASYVGNVACIKCLLSKPDVPVDPQCKIGLTPLMIVADNNYIEAADFLKLRGASLTMIDSDKKNAKYYARTPEMKKLLNTN
jgi:ankyrin repeat protein